MIKLFGFSQILKKDETVTITRLESVDWVDGRPVQRPQNAFQVIANIQPVNGRDLLLVPEGDRFREQYWMYLDNSFFKVNMGLEVTGPTSLRTNDRVTRLGVNYQVQSIEQWGTFCRCRIMRIDVGPNASNEGI